MEEHNPVHDPGSLTNNPDIIRRLPEFAHTVSDGGDHVGIYGKGTDTTGVYGESQSEEGVIGTSQSGEGVFGMSASGIGIHGRGGKLAGQFDGNVQVNGTCTITVDIILANADCAEEFDVSGVTDVEAGTVVVLDQGGALHPSQQAYDRRVAGVISGAGDYRPGLILDKKGSSEGRMPVALVGKVYCKVDAQYDSIEVGDLLTTSDTLGHAMKAADPLKAFGSVIGKALRPLEAGKGTIPILIALQ